MVRKRVWAHATSFGRDRLFHGTARSATRSRGRAYRRCRRGARHRSAGSWSTAAARRTGTSRFGSTSRGGARRDRFVVGGAVMTELIEKPVSIAEPSLYLDRLSVIESGEQTWPKIERRMAPRRRDESMRGEDRRRALATTTRVSDDLTITVTPDAAGVAADGQAGPSRRECRRRTPERPPASARPARPPLPQHRGPRRHLRRVVRRGRRRDRPLRHSVRQPRDRRTGGAASRSPPSGSSVVLISRAYESRFLASSAEEYRRVINAAVGLIAGVAVISYLFKTEIARGYVVLALPICMVVALLGRYVARRRLAPCPQAGPLPARCRRRRPRVGRARPRLRASSQP